MQNPVFEIQNLTFAYRNHVIFTQANLNLNHPGVFGLVGPNGSGKTTLFNLIAGLLPLSQGKINWLGQPNAIAYMQDNSVLYPYLTGQDHIQFVARQQHADSQHVQVLIDRLQIGDFIDRPVQTLSLGQKQRLMIVLALIPNANLLLMDEPLNGLDPDSVFIIRELLQDLNASPQIVLVSSHNLDELQKVTSNLIFKVDTGLTLATNLTDPEAYYTHLYHQPKGVGSDA